MFVLILCTINIFKDIVIIRLYLSR